MTPMILVPQPSEYVPHGQVSPHQALLPLCNAIETHLQAPVRCLASDVPQIKKQTCNTLLILHTPLCSSEEPRIFILSHNFVSLSMETPSLFACLVPLSSQRKEESTAFQVSNPLPARHGCLHVCLIWCQLGWVMGTKSWFLLHWEESLSLALFLSHR